MEPEHEMSTLGVSRSVGQRSMSRQAELGHKNPFSEMFRELPTNHMKKVKGQDHKKINLEA